ncbi:Glycosyltransferase involved in cell wall bisynthesis [Devosia lucknowensis]|uniref:Glycosyltransferase involved in cell wall bisynthesis n=1 Tax=Devosia lucknowensis TaxID=1096929 RepID=A0A1Y6EKH3_9HYPH|nr:glycosyltransferase family 4 protein [Devosia lucknowensis]SMQ63097.1 Glycosyltransferase involved in cell wall bisynthesis [Devosia lucknowensis]
MAKQSLRILQVLRAPVGGLFRHVADLTRALSAKGHSVGIVVDSLANDAQTEGLLLGLEAYAALGIHRFPMPRLFGRSDLSTPFAVSALARRLDVDIMHGHGAKGGFYARLAAYGRNRAEVYYTPHGGVLHFPADKASGKLFHRIERTLMAKTSAIIFESHFAEKTYSALIGAPTCPGKVIHNGLRPDEFMPVEHRSDAADFVFVGELRALKGIFQLVEALADTRHPDGRPPNLVMAGDGPDRAELEARIAELGLGARVNLVGSKPAREVFALGRYAVVPSLAESLPYVVLEAAAAQLPLISTRVGGIPEIFGPTSDSLIPPGDAGALAATMNRMLADPDSAETEMRQRLAHIEAQFSLARMADAIEQLYRGAQ